MREGPQTRAGSIGRGEAVALLAIVALGAALRFVDLPTRGTWDADQGTDMLVLWRMIHEGTWPLLGPPTSIGDVHHGVLYYYLLAPVAFLSRADPLAVVAFVALAGTAAVAVVWWLAREIGGRAAGIVAALLTAVSASAIEESTFIWNPNMIALSSALSLAAAWRAWTTRHAGWWVVVAAAQAVTMHLHVLGAVMLVPLGALLVADARRRDRAAGRTSVWRAALLGGALIALSYVPLAVHELGSGFAETRAAADYLFGGAEGGGPSLVTRLIVVPLRVLSWPVAGLVTARPVVAILLALAVVAVLVWRLGAARAQERTAVRWLAGTLAWSSLTLALAASSLATVVPGLPNDHYHAFLDPVVFVTLGLGAAALWTARRPIGQVAAVAGVAAVVGLNASIWPPPTSPDGGYPQAEEAARRILATVGDGPFVLDGLPALKNPNAYGFPLRRLGGTPDLVDDMGVEQLVIACDRLLEPIIGAQCGGPAEEQRVRELGDRTTLVERFAASDRTVISIYR